MSSHRFVGDACEKALSWLRSLPRVAENTLRNDPGRIVKHKRGRGRYGGKTHGCGQKGSKQRMNYMRTGYETGNTPFYMRFQDELYYLGHHLKRQYPPLSLLKLQKMIDLDRIDPRYPIDLGTIIRTGLYWIEPLHKQYGVNITDEGINKFSAKIDLEVQWISEPAIAAIERLGGSVTMAYYDFHSLSALIDPLTFFKKGEPIPKRLLPPEDAIEAYTDPKRRGYLADPQAIEYERGVLAQKYGYELIVRDPPLRKDPRQIFFGLEPGWVVNLKDKVILKPKDKELIEYYQS